MARGWQIAQRAEVKEFAAAADTFSDATSCFPAPLDLRPQRLVRDARRRRSLGDSAGDRPHARHRRLALRRSQPAGRSGRARDRPRRPLRREVRAQGRPHLRQRGPGPGNGPESDGRQPVQLGRLLHASDGGVHGRRARRLVRRPQPEARGRARAAPEPLARPDRDCRLRGCLQVGQRRLGTDARLLARRPARASDDRPRAPRRPRSDDGRAPEAGRPR